MKSRADSASEVRRVLDSLKEFLTTGTAKLSEADTRAEFIDPLLKALGYEGIAHVQREVYVRDTKEYLDYVLSVAGQQKIGVEAKALGKSITDTDAGQVIQYCSILGIEWAVVTNGRAWRLYHQFAKADLAGKLLFSLDLAAWNSDDEFDALFSQLWLASEAAFEGSDGPLAWLRAQRLDGFLRDALTNPGSPEVKYLRGRLTRGDVVATSEDVAAWFKGKLLEAPPIPPATATPSKAISERPPRGSVSPVRSTGRQSADVSYWLVPAGARPGLTGLESLQHWLGKGMWGFWESTPGRRSLQAGDRVAFYTSDKKVRAVVARATVRAPADLLVAPNEWPEPLPQQKPVYKLPLVDVVWLSSGRTLTDPGFRSELDAFHGLDVARPWGWFVVTTRRLTEADFRRLSGEP